MRVAVLWTQMSGYFSACLRELATQAGAKIFVAYQRPTADAPFDQNDFDWFAQSQTYTYSIDKATLLQEVRAFRPDVLYVCSWHISAFRYVARRLHYSVPTIFFMDNQWKGSLKQRLGVATAGIYLHPIFDGVCLPGDRQAHFARKLGYSESAIQTGMNSCDHPKFERIFRQRQTSVVPLPKSFIYVGRYSREKGIDTLANAYKLYRGYSQNPWPLHCFGAGELKSVLHGLEGLTVNPFVQPIDVPALMGSASCLVLASESEAWGIVIHEATAAGLAVICTSVCGAVPHLLQDGYNGYLAEAENPLSIASAMVRYSSMDDRSREEMSSNSHLMSLQFTPERWTRNFLSIVDRVKRNRT